MSLRTLRFKIRQDGRVEETVEGIVGEGCIDLTEKLEAALGSVEQRKPTSEAFLQKRVQKQTIQPKFTDVTFQHSKNTTSQERVFKTGSN